MYRFDVRDFGHWRAIARSMLTRQVHPDAIEWIDDAEPPTTQPYVPPAPPHGGHTVPRRYLSLTSTAARADDPERWAVFYRLAWRLTHGEGELLEDEGDPDVRRLLALTARVEARDRPPGGHARSAAQWVPTAADHPTLTEAMRHCAACERCHHGDAVSGGGAFAAPVLVVAEAPDADAEAAGWPLVGESGEALGEALERAGVPLRRVRTTYAIKHRAGEGETKSRRGEVAGICRPWLMAEIALDPPAAIVALGEVAARGAIGRGGRRDDPTEAHDGPAGIPVFVAPTLEQIRLARAAGIERPFAALVDALAAAEAVVEPAPQQVAARPMAIAEPRRGRG